MGRILVCCIVGARKTPWKWPLAHRLSWFFFMNFMLWQNVVQWLQSSFKDEAHALGTLHRDFA